MKTTNESPRIDLSKYINKIVRFNERDCGFGRYAIIKSINDDILEYELASGMKGECRSEFVISIRECDYVERQKFLAKRNGGA